MLHSPQITELKSKSAAAFRNRLFLGVLLANLLVIGLVALSALHSYQQYQTNAEITTRNLAHTLEKETAGTLKTIDEAMLSVLEMVELQQRAHSMDVVSLNAKIQRIHGRLPELDALRITDRAGNLIAGSGVDVTKKVNLADRLHFMRLRDQPAAGLVFSKPQISRVSQTWVIAMARRISQADGQFGGMIFATLSLDHFSHSYAALNLGPGGIVAMRDSQMRLLARHPDPSQIDLKIGSKEISAELQQLISAGKTSATYRTEDSAKFLARTLTIKKLDDFPLHIMVGLAPADYLADWRKNTLKQSFVVVLFMVITLVSARLLYRAWLNQQQANVTLQQQKALYHDLVEDSAMLIVRFQPDTRIIFANSSYADFFGMKPDQLIHQYWLDLLPADADKQAIRQMIAQLTPQQPVSTFNEIQAENIHHEMRCTRWSHHAFFDEHGNMTYLQSVGLDVTERKMAELKLAASELRLRTIIETEPECIKIVDANLMLTQMNPAGLAMIEADNVEQVTGRSVLGLIADEYRAAFVQMHQRVMAGEAAMMEFEVIGLKGGRRWLETHAVPMQNGDQRVQLAITRDITQRKQSEASLRLAASVFTNSHDGVMITDANNLIIDVNPAFTRITGYERAEVVGLSPRLLASGRQNTDFYADLWHSLNQQNFWRGEIWNRRKDGELYEELLSISVMRDAADKVMHYLAVFSDVSQVKAHAIEIERITHYDILTGVPNRRLLTNRLDNAIAQTLHNKKSMAVCYLDLDDFKPINDRFGHLTGDLLLIEITSRLQSMLRADDTLARLSGDEFILLLTNIADENGCQQILQRILAAVSQPISLPEATLQMTASIGVTLFPQDDSDADTLVRHADQAMYRAKEAGKNRYHQFDPDHDRLAQSHRDQLLRLEEALNNNEFVLYYQPKVNLLTGEVIGAEALIRWQHPELGLRAPGTFLHYLSGSELEIAVGNWVISSVLQQLSCWNQAGLFLKVSLNISADHLLQADFADSLRQVLEKYPEVNPADVELEILETAALDDIEQAARILIACRSIGVSFALDDFGTGYSSLTYFRTLPIDTLKIDQSFVRDMLNDPEDFGIVESVVRLAQAFNREVIAEGVETLEHGAMLIHMGCVQAQGYGIARPMPAEHFIDWIARWLHQAAWLTLDSRLTEREDLSLLVAEQSHRNWVNTIVESLDNPQAEMAVSLHSHHCRFGRWYYGRGTVRYGALQEFKDIEQPHEQVHGLGSEMINLVQNGQVETARKRLPELFELRDRLLVLLDALIEIAANTAK